MNRLYLITEYFETSYECPIDRQCYVFSAKNMRELRKLAMWSIHNNISIKIIGYTPLLSGEIT